MEAIIGIPTLAHFKTMSAVCLPVLVEIHWENLTFCNNAYKD